jgi:7,8-dihydroneopterin aldolase/epimerase/oxygenase
VRGLRRVFIRDMVLQASIGVHLHEHGRRQRVRVNLDLAVIDDGPGPDQLAHVVDYEAVAARVRGVVHAGHVRLAETLAERIAEVCLVDSRVRRVRVRVEKLDIFADAESAGVEIERRPPKLSTPENAE